MTVGQGNSPQAIHSKDNLLRIIYLDDDGYVRGLYADPVLGLYNDLVFADKGRISPDTEVSFPSIKRFAHYGAYGFWSSEDVHRFVIFFMPVDISDSLIDGHVQFGVSSNVSTFNVNLVNIRGEILNRYRALVTPGTMMNFYFSIGDTDETSLGTFYVDRANASYPEEDVAVSGRNCIGKLLKEQTFDENTLFNEGTIHDNLNAIMELAGVEHYFCGDPGTDQQLDFDPDTTILEGLEYVKSLMVNWKIAETIDGVVGIAAADDLRFDQPGVYEFQRDHTCWSYNIEYDDADAAARVCVYAEGTEEGSPTVRVYQDVEYNRWWEQPPHRTLYVKTANGATQAQCLAIAEELAASLAASGRLETFAGLFTPQLTLGDEVQITDEEGVVDTLGSVTDVAHYFGRGGFYTQFTVDSGGRMGRVRLKDLIETAAAFPTVFTGKKEDPEPEEEVVVELKNKSALTVFSDTVISGSFNMQSGTLCVAVLTHTSALTAPSGWTSIVTTNGVSGQLMSIMYKFTTGGSVEYEFSQETAGQMFLNLASFSSAGIPTTAVHQTIEQADLLTFGKNISNAVLWCIQRAAWTGNDKWTVTGVGLGNIMQLENGGGKLLCIFDNTDMGTLTARESNGAENVTEHYAIQIPVAE